MNDSDQSGRLSVKNAAVSALSARIGHAERLRGIRHQRIGDGEFTRDLTSCDDWRSAIESLGVSLPDVNGEELASLHARMLAYHEAAE
jgi:hypothetical protein